MGLRYVAFRLYHEVLRRSGRLKNKFPTPSGQVEMVDKAEWLRTSSPFFFTDRASLAVARRELPALAARMDRLRAGELQFFRGDWISWADDSSSMVHPLTGYRYRKEDHWTSVPDLDAERGDIKYVWEKSRFSWLHDVVRDDYHHQKDHGEWVFAELDRWMNENPVNRGPNWRCSQEISLRTLNWVFALRYYQDHPAFTEARWQRIVNVIYWQLHHVYQNINFSRIAVRNNHAITECLMLFLGGHFFPFWPEAEGWRTQGKKWLEAEIAYQIYPDGSYLQHSMNYHRVVVQLLSWGIVLGEACGDRLAPVVYERAAATLAFLGNCADPASGHLPNYGNNDGALFFQFNEAAYRDYRPQLNALSLALGKASMHTDAESSETAQWYGLPQSTPPVQNPATAGAGSYPEGGYYTWREADTFTFLRCAAYRDRPAQADNLHLDIWMRGENVFRDAGTYKYNDAPELLRNFWGTKGHNTVSLEGLDQMLKGGRFIWYYWTKNAEVQTRATAEYWEFTGTIDAFHHCQPGIRHRRRVRKYKDTARWEISDEMMGKPAIAMRQHWHPHPAWLHRIQLEATDEDGRALSVRREEGWYSSHYGQKEASPRLTFSTPTQRIKTIITIV